MGFKAGSVAPPTGKVKVLDSIQDRFAAFERKMPKDGYLGDDVGGTAKLPPSTSAWAVPWRPKSAPPRKELMKPGSYSPGPCYYPNDTWFGRGPHGQGPEYTLTGVSFRAPANAKKTKMDEMPGPKYTLTDGFGVQVDSRYPSRQSGKFGEYDRQTISWDAPDSPGPAHYNPPGATIVTPKERPNGFGGSKTGWAYGLAPDYRPGPGDYKLPPAIGSQLPKRPPGYHPVKKSFAAASFGRGDRAGTSHMPKVGRASPGPAYMLRASVGEQVSSQMKSSPNASFSKADRFYYDKRLSGSTGAAGAKAAAAFAATR